MKSKIYKPFGIYVPMFSELTLALALARFNEKAKGITLRTPLAQFGRPNRKLIGAEILPELLDNTLLPGMSKQYADVRFRTNVALPNSRFAPPVLQANGLFSSFELSLSHSSIRSAMDAQLLAKLNELVNGANDFETMNRLIGWFDTVITMALKERLEVERWNAMVTAQVVRVGVNGQSETIYMPNASGQRVAAGSTWSNNSNDPMPDIMARKQWGADRGLALARIITSSKVEGILIRNEKMRGYVTGQTTGLIPQATQAGLAQLFQAQGLPPIELYDLVYSKETGTARFLPDDAMVFVFASGRDYVIDLGDAEPITLPNTLGNVVLGVPLGQTQAGAYSNVTLQEIYPPSITAEGVQEAMPFLAEPEGFTVITGIA